MGLGGVGGGHVRRTNVVPAYKRVLCPQGSVGSYALPVRCPGVRVEPIW